MNKSTREVSRCFEIKSGLSGTLSSCHTDPALIVAPCARILQVTSGVVETRG